MRLTTDLYWSLVYIMWMPFRISAVPVCPQGYISRHMWGLDKFHRMICCKIVPGNCNEGSYVKTCEVDFGEDRCTSCPKGTYIMDQTNSTNVHKCVRYSCPFNTIMTGYLSKTGCRKPCVCDTEKNFFGEDPCKCRIFTGSCTKGTQLALNGSCVNTSTIYKVSPDDPGFRPKEDRLHNDTYDSFSTVNSDEQTLYMISSLIAALFGVGIAVTVIICCFTCKKNTADNQTNHGMASKDPNNASEHDDTETKEVESQEREQTYIPLVVVYPMPRTHCIDDEPSPMMEENSTGVTRMMVPSGSTTEYHVPYRDRSVEEI